MAGFLLFSLAVHAIPIATLRFVPPDPVTLINKAPLEIVLVNARHARAPSQYDVLAQANLDGGGNTDLANQRLQSPLPPQVVENPSDELVQAQQRQQTLENRQQKLMTALQASASVRAVDVPPQQAPQSAPLDITTLREQAKEIERREAEISQALQNYQSRPRKAFVSARAKGVVEARYVDDWRIKIERIGNLNFPVDARGQRLYGRMLVTVEIRADGSLAGVSVSPSSGNPELDAAAKRIVQLAAPFPPLPAGIVDGTGKPADILSITRTWTFSRGDNSLR
jgi:protein TonB